MFLQQIVMMLLVWSLTGSSQKQRPVILANDSVCYLCRGGNSINSTDQEIRSRHLTADHRADAQTWNLCVSYK